MHSLAKYASTLTRAPITYDPGVNYVVSFSGGRSSAMLLRLILNEFGGALPDNFIVLFANTGKEHPGTLDFVNQIETRWDVPIHWLEFDGLGDAKKSATNPEYMNLKVKKVDHQTASREGAPWIKVIEAAPGYAPRRAARICTYYMKVGTMWSYMNQMGCVPFTNLVGYRHDEITRLHASEMKCARDPARPKVMAPLIAAGIAREGVMRFWKDQDFDLDIPEYAGNCDMCFLKGRKQLKHVAHNNPGMIDWWIEADEYAMNLGATRPMLPDGGYAALLNEIAESGGLEDDDMLTGGFECACTD